jgi:hypothetical protein
MANRIRRTKQQVANALEKKLTGMKKNMKEEARKAESHKAIIIGKALQGRANGGNANAKRELDEIVAGLTRDQDRRAFGLDPLPKPEPEAEAAAPAPKPSVDDPLAAALAHRKQAIGVWERCDKSPAEKAKVAEAMAAVERLTGKVWDKMELRERAGWGLSDRPGELL